jgi:hypothetical protein
MVTVQVREPHVPNSNLSIVCAKLMKINIFFAFWIISPNRDDVQKKTFACHPEFSRL